MEGFRRGYRDITMCTSFSSPSESPPDAAAVLANTARLGEYFALPDASAPGELVWHPLVSLLEETTIRDLVDRSRRAIATAMSCDRDEISVRLAASSFQLGIAARILSPLIGAASCHSVLPVLNKESIRWRRVGHSVLFAAHEIEFVTVVGPADAAYAIAGSALHDLFDPLNAILSAAVSLSPKISWGNVSSAANGAVTVLTSTHPDRERAGRALVRALLETAPLHGTGTFDTGAFTRRSCCLFYQAPGSGFCGDCVLIS
ncbi:(2Fe-2S)-binding protein [Mycolicibacterium vaccae]|uniref:(2Fe-2S)-binding protein n=1 Tax=Mycolicibacterium vaccae TaxID=1810 RepID=UPI003D05268D